MPTPKFARDPAPGPDGNIYISVMYGNKIARFDPRSQAFKEWDLPPGARPHGLLVDRNGQVWYTGNGNGTIGKLDPATGKVLKGNALPAGRSGGPYAVTVDGRSIVWANEISADTVVRLDPTTGQIRVFPLPSKDGASGRWSWTRRGVSGIWAATMAASA